MLEIMLEVQLQPGMHATIGMHNYNTHLKGFNIHNKTTMHATITQSCSSCSTAHTLLNISVCVYRRSEVLPQISLGPGNGLYMISKHYVAQASNSKSLQLLYHIFPGKV